MSPLMVFIFPNHTLNARLSNFSPLILLHFFTFFISLPFLPQHKQKRLLMMMRCQWDADDDDEMTMRRRPRDDDDEMTMMTRLPGWWDYHEDKTTTRARPMGRDMMFWSVRSAADSHVRIKPKEAPMTPVKQFNLMDVECLSSWNWNAQWNLSEAMDGLVMRSLSKMLLG